MAQSTSRSPERDLTKDLDLTQTGTGSLLDLAAEVKQNTARYSHALTVATSVCCSKSRPCVRD